VRSIFDFGFNDRRRGIALTARVEGGAAAASEGRGSGLKLVTVVNHRFEFFGVAFDGEDDGSFLDAIVAGGDGGDDLSRIREGEPDGEGAVGTKLNVLALKGDLGVGFGRAVDDQFGVDLEVETARDRGERAGTEALEREALHRPAESLFKEVAKVAGDAAGAVLAARLMIDFLELILNA